MIHWWSAGIVAVCAREFRRIWHLPQRGFIGFGGFFWLLLFVFVLCWYILPAAILIAVAGACFAANLVTAGCELLMLPFRKRPRAPQPG